MLVAKVGGNISGKMVGRLHSKAATYSKDEMQMNYSFQPNGLWFVFDEASGKTIAKDFETSAQAISFIHSERVRVSR